MQPDATTDPAAPVPHRNLLVHDARLIVATIVLAALVVFALDNRRRTSVSWIVGSGSAPLWAVLTAAAVAGALVGSLASHRSARHH